MEQKSLVSDGFSRYFHIGQAINIQLDDGSKQRFQSQLVGLKEGSYLLIEQPCLVKYGALRDRLFSNQELIVRTIDEKMSGDVVGFRSSVNCKLESPDRLLAISYPGSIEILELRKESRIIVQIPCQITDAEDATALEATITDLSAAGCRIEIRYKEDPVFKTDDMVTVNYTHPVSNEKESKKAAIKSSRKQNSWYVMGLLFD